MKYKTIKENNNNNEVNQPQTEATENHNRII